ncbi:MAG: tagaturonate reductase [Allomuricauda sp.]
MSKKRPIKIVQFGEGNFLRAFVDFAFHKLNTELDFNAGIAVVQPIENGLVDVLNEQEGRYTLFSKGVVEGTEIQEKYRIDAIELAVNPYADFESFIMLAHEPELQFVVSNTTEAGIAYDEKDTPNMAPPNSFPAKLTVFLYERFKHFKGDYDKALSIIPCELINTNADALMTLLLQYCTAWELGSDFKNWIENGCSFHNTLVDRIVPGYPKDDILSYTQQLDYEDKLIVTSEVFFLWVIEGDEALKKRLPFHKTGLDVKIVSDMQPYRTRKVRILNGAHTAMVPFSLMYGNSTVKETIDDKFTGKFVSDIIFDEIIPTLELDKAELEIFANAVLDRFRNPFIKHYLASIALNTISKFKVRVLPSLLQYKKNTGKLPAGLVFAFACLLRFYKGEWKGEKLPVNDDENIVSYIQKIWKSTHDVQSIVDGIIAEEKFWGQDLTKVAGLGEALTIALEHIERNGIEVGFNEFCNHLKK